MDLLERMARADCGATKETSSGPLRMIAHVMKAAALSVDADGATVALRSAMPLEQFVGLLSTLDARSLGGNPS